MDQPATIPTGVPQLDTILGGGLVQNSLLLITGQTGSGKTVLAAQIASAFANRGENVLFVTAFAEPHNKLIRNLSAFRFFQRDLIGDRLRFINLLHQLMSSTDEAADTIVREAREHGSQLVVLDGFQGVRVSSHEPTSANQFLYDLSAKLSLLGVTGLITYDFEDFSGATSGELSAVDGVITLEQELAGERAIRILRVVKQRGAKPLLGRHSFQITDDGLICYPRQESIVTTGDGAPGSDRLTFGIAALDLMLHGGLAQGTSTIIAGNEGTGKTLLGLYFLMQATAAGKHAMLVSFHETEPQIIAKGKSFGLGIQAAIDAKLLTILHFIPSELNADMVAHDVRTIVEANDVQRIFIDSFNDIQQSFIERDRAPDFFTALNVYLQHHDVTTCIIQELDTGQGSRWASIGKPWATLADNIIILNYDEEEEHKLTISIRKMRFSSHDRQPHTYVISDQGLQIATDAIDDLGRS